MWMLATFPDCQHFGNSALEPTRQGVYLPNVSVREHFSNHKTFLIIKHRFIFAEMVFDYYDHEGRCCQGRETVPLASSRRAVSPVKLGHQPSAGGSLTNCHGADS
jgi:hypothetical protein